MRGLLLELTRFTAKLVVEVEGDEERSKVVGVREVRRSEQWRWITSKCRPPERGKMGETRLER